MNNLRYLSEISFRNIKRYRLTSVIRLICFSLCFFVILLYMGVFFGSKKRLNIVGNIKNIDNRSMLAVQHESEIPDTFSHYSFFANQNMVFYEGKYLSGVGIRVIDVDYPDLFEEFFAEGGKIENSEKECLVGSRVREKYNIALGDKILIKDSIFTVRGITADNLDSGHILINNIDVVNVGYPRLFFLDDSTVPQGIAKSGNLYVHNEIEKYFNLSDDSKKVEREVLCICAVVLLYSMVSIYSIHMFYMEKRTIATDVCYCTGVSRSAFFAQNLMENTIVSMAGAIVAYLSAVSMKAPLKRLNLREFDFPICALAVALLFALLASLLLAAKSIRKKK